MSDAPQIGLALGGGGARGLAHIHVLKAFDDMGLKPCAIAGCSIGAMIGAPYAAGHTAREIETHILAQTRSARDLFTRALTCRAGKFSQLFLGEWGSVLMDGEKIVGEFLPPLPPRFEDLAIPLTVMTADYYGRSAHPLTQGPLAIAVAASLALPTIIQPVVHDGRVLIDGGYVNPLPFDTLPDCSHVIACDVTGGPVLPADADRTRLPKMMDAVFNSIFLMAGSIISEKLRTRQPELLIRPSIEAYQVLDFHKAKEILLATESVYDQTRAFLESVAEEQA